MLNNETIPTRTWPIKENHIVYGRVPELSDAPDAAEIARINAEHLITTPLRPADLLFVFGRGAALHETVDAAVDLWRRGSSAMPW